jgi:hypothetical protein
MEPFRLDDTARPAYHAAAAAAANFVVTSLAISADLFLGRIDRVSSLGGRVANTFEKERGASPAQPRHIKNRDRASHGARSPEHVGRRSIHGGGDHDPLQRGGLLLEVTTFEGRDTDHSVRYCPRWATSMRVISSWTFSNRSHGGRPCSSL